MAPDILIIEFDASARLHLAQHLREESLTVFEAEQEAEAMKMLAERDFDVVLISLERLKREGLHLIRAIKRARPKTEVITLNSPESLDLSIEAMKLGVFDDFLEPFERKSLIHSLWRAYRKCHAKELSTKS